MSKLFKYLVKISLLILYVDALQCFLGIIISKSSYSFLFCNSAPFLSQLGAYFNFMGPLEVEVKGRKIMILFSTLTGVFIIHVLLKYLPVKFLNIINGLFIFDFHLRVLNLLL